MRDVQAWATFTSSPESVSSHAYQRRQRIQSSSPIFVNTEQESERALLQVVKRLGDGCGGCDRCDGFALREVTPCVGIYNIHICIPAYLLPHHIAKKVILRAPSSPQHGHNSTSSASCTTTTATMHHAPCSTHHRSARSELQVCRHSRCSVDAAVNVVEAVDVALSSPC
jgi:hypothetical protein